MTEEMNEILEDQLQDAEGVVAENLNTAEANTGATKLKGASVYMAEKPAVDVSEETVADLVAEQEHDQYLKERHQQAINDLKVSSNSSKPQLIMGLALLGLLAVVVIIARILG